MESCLYLADFGVFAFTARPCLLHTDNKELSEVVLRIARRLLPP